MSINDDGSDHTAPPLRGEGYLTLHFNDSLAVPRFQVRAVHIRPDVEMALSNEVTLDEIEAHVQRIADDAAIMLLEVAQFRRDIPRHQELYARELARRATKLAASDDGDVG